MKLSPIRRRAAFLVAGTLDALFLIVAVFGTPLFKSVFIVLAAVFIFVLIALLIETSES